MRRVNYEAHTSHQVVSSNALWGLDDNSTDIIQIQDYGYTVVTLVLPGSCLVS